MKDVERGAWSETDFPIIFDARRANDGEAL